MVVAVNREAQSVLLVLVGGAVLRISVGDVYLRYVKEGLRPFLLVSGVLLVVLGATSLWRESFSRRASRAEATPGGAGSGAAGSGAAGGAADGQAEAILTDPIVVPAASGPTVVDEASLHGHDHGHGPRVAWLLLLPVFAIILVAPPALGSYAATRGSGAVAEPTSDYAPLPPGDPVEVTLTEYAGRAIWDAGRSLTGRTVRMTGFVTPSETAGGDAYLARIALSCCAADGRPIKVAVRGLRVADHPPDTWLTITGRYVAAPRSAAGATIPTLEPEDIRRIPAPVQPYEG